MIVRIFRVLFGKYNVCISNVGGFFKKKFFTLRKCHKINTRFALDASLAYLWKKSMRFKKKKKRKKTTRHEYRHLNRVSLDRNSCTGRMFSDSPELDVRARGSVYGSPDHR